MTEFTVAVYRNPVEHKIRLGQVAKWAEHSTRTGGDYETAESGDASGPTLPSQAFTLAQRRGGAATIHNAALNPGTCRG